MKPIEVPMESVKQHWLLPMLRKVDPICVSRLRQAIRQRAKLPPLLVHKDGYIISGNRRHEAYLKECEPGTLIRVIVKDTSWGEVLKQVVRANVTHGDPMDGVTRRNLTLQLKDAGVSSKEIAKLFWVEPKRVDVWSKDFVMVRIGKVVTGKRSEVVRFSMKYGMDIKPGKVITQKQYLKSQGKDIGVKAKYLAQQLSRWLEEDWIDLADEETHKALVELRDALNAAKL